MRRWMHAIKNCVEVLKMKPEEATKMIYKVDKARTAYHKRYAKYAPGDLDSKQIMIDSACWELRERQKCWQRSYSGDLDYRY